MHLNTRPFFLAWTAVSIFCLAGCPANPGSEPGGTGGAQSAGTSGAGGTSPVGSGGASSGTGGSVATGGSGVVGSGGGGSGGMTPGSGGVTATGGGGVGGRAAGGGGAGGRAAGSGGAAGAGTATRFSFFTTSLVAMRQLSGSQNGFGGDLRFGETTGLAGADKICTTVANTSMPGNGKSWRAFLSVGAAATGGAVNAIDRIGPGPWYDRMGRVVSMNTAALLNQRPQGADTAIVNDLPNENGIPNHNPDGMGQVDNHHVLTGASATGGLYTACTTGNCNCSDWTSIAATSGRPRIGFSWSIQTRIHWISGQDEAGCGAGVFITGTGGPDLTNPIVGSGGGYGAIYCFALTP